MMWTDVDVHLIFANVDICFDDMMTMRMMLTMTTNAFDGDGDDLANDCGCVWSTTMRSVNCANDHDIGFDYRNCYVDNTRIGHAIDCDSSNNHVVDMPGVFAVTWPDCVYHLNASICPDSV